MSTSVSAQKYAELRSKIAEAKKQMADTAKSLFTEMSAELFAENPTLVSFGWTQYTPYFNDGEQCVFSCNGSYPTVSVNVNGDLHSHDSNRGGMLVNGKEEKSADDLVRTFRSMGVDSFSKNGKQYAYNPITSEVTADGVKVPSYEDVRKIFRPMEQVVSAFMENFADEDMETMFGDHVRVVVHRDGKIEIEEYQHD